ncbi:hypothetical protein [Agromyces larvae]|uniref:Uncharacterized protein n=1 Tax=Agromyces larvae TaxID=2929802 RepID=A0ABY4BXF9_9MICO|nr:hypothetical protein [Agromyces larvae]UOE43867.1 hypothetical protein MTO99_17130 [Agromyces larvae]
MTSFEAAKALNTRLTAANHNWNQGQYFERGVAGAVVSALAYVLDGREIDYLDALVPDDHNGELLVLAFAGDLIFDVRYDPTSNVTVTSRRLDDVEQVVITQTPNYLSSWGTEDQAEAIVQVAGVPFGLPFPMATSKCRVEFTEYLPKLIWHEASAASTSGS